MKFLEPNELFKLDSPILKSVSEYSCGTGELSRSLLDTKSCIVLDMGSEVFLWTGKDISSDLREISSNFFAVFCLLI